MGFYTFGPLLVIDDSTLEPAINITGSAQDADTLATVTTYDMAGDPVALTTNAKGYVGQFQVPDTSPRLRVTFGTMPLELIAQEIVDVAGDVAGAVADWLASNPPTNPPLATGTETIAGTSSTTAVTPAGLEAKVPTLPFVPLTAESAATSAENIDRVALVCEFPVRENGETSWPQGFAINLDADELYVANQKGAELRIDVRELSTGLRKSWKIVTTEVGAYTENLPYFYNGLDELCFIVRAKAMADVADGFYAIYNYTTGTLGPNIAIKGQVRAEHVGDYLVTTDSYAYSIKNAYVYDWDSVVAGAPSLLKKIPFENAGVSAGKNQGFTFAGGVFVFFHGSQAAGHPGFTVYDHTGRLVTQREYSHDDFRAAVNAMVDAQFTNSAYLYEAEGVSHLYGTRLVSAHVMNDNPTVAADGRVLIMDHGRLDGVNIVPTINIDYVYDTGWVELTLLNGWTAANAITPAARRIGNQVMYRGNLVNSTASTTLSTAFVIPSGMGPSAQTNLALSSNTTATMAAIAQSNGDMQFYSSVATTAWRPLSSLSYFID